MAQVTLQIPWSFVAERLALGWREIHFGLAAGLVTPAFAHAAGIARLETALDDPLLLALACADDDHETRDAVQRLADRSPVGRPCDATWLYLAMAWIHAHHAHPLSVIDALYADFDYPDAIAGLVSYMPFDGPTDPDGGRARRLADWAAWLDTEQHRLKTLTP